MIGLRRAFVKVLVLVPITILAVALAIRPGGLVSYTPATRLGVHAMMAFWIAIPAALSVLAYQRKQVRAYIMLMSALMFPMFVHIGSAAKNLFFLGDATVERVPIDIIGDLFELTMLAVLFVSTYICAIKQSSQANSSISDNIFIVILILLPLILFGAVWLFVLNYLTPVLLDGISWVLGSITLICFVTVLLLIPRFRSYGFPFDSGYLASSLLLFSISVLSLLYSLPDPIMNWEFAESLQMAGYLLLALCLGVPFLRGEGYKRKSAYGIIIGRILIAYLPFVIETLELFGQIDVLNLLAYSIIHLGAATLSIMMAILLYAYPKKKTSWSHYPLILVFGMWAGIAIVLVFSLVFPFLTPRGEPITPITVGSLLTVGLLYLTILWTKKPPLERGKSPSVYQLLLILVGLVATVVAGEIINQIVLTFSPLQEYNPLGSTLIVSSNLFIMFAFAYIIFLLAEGSKGRSPVELYVTFFLSMWILPNILKAYYPTWTPGWWVSEILLFAGLLAGPPILIWMYVKSMQEVEDSHKRANMYADLLMHDVSNYNQMMMMSLELLGSNDLAETKRVRLAEDGRQVISFSEQLISNVRLLSKADKLKTTELRPTSLVDTIVGALDLFTRRVGSGELIVEFKSEDASAYVMANEFLVHIFLNILYSALECRTRGESVIIKMNEIIHSGNNYWQINIIAPGRKAGVDDGYSSGTLGLLAAQLMTESLNGQLSVETYERTELCEGRLFSIRLQAIEPHSIGTH
ncbi:MAG: hypothetical protein ACFFDQ_11745 [Candidatus Thorarchaeota archaeon]